MNDKKTTVDNLKVFVKDFVDERDWSQFHNPKNISMALAIEASELMDIFKWDSNDESEKKMSVDISRQDAIDELADVIIYSIAFANKNGIDISDAILKKMEKNEKKYPSKKFRVKLQPYSLILYPSFFALSIDTLYIFRICSVSV